MRVPTRGRRVVAALGVVAFVVGLASAPTVWAHASLESTTPVANAVLETGPASIVLDFDEDVEVALSTVSLFGAGRTEVLIGEATVGADKIGRAHV